MSAYLGALLDLHCLLFAFAKATYKIPRYRNLLSDFALLSVKQLDLCSLLCYGKRGYGCLHAQVSKLA